jgi:hypothetical protein
MIKLLLLCISELVIISCSQLSSEEKLIKDSLERKVDLGMFERVHYSDTTMSFEGFRKRYSYLYLVSLQDGCRPCYQEYVQWQNGMKNLSLADNFTILFIIHGKSYDKFISELMINEPEFDLSLESFFIAMDPDQEYIDNNSDIDPRIIERSIMTDDKNKIILIGKPFASKQMTDLFQSLLLE